MIKFKVGEQARVWLNYRRQSCVITAIDGDDITVTYTWSMTPDSRTTITVESNRIIKSNIINKQERT